ncbi:hypothetical protein MSAN_01645800 [Mycena sanguinolenta]|uniref:Uncharacterized protein n=1 Tax=Mycena sanguinolenta TaxID=230812 RepID=A0A8H6XYU2_9AGAR|nr:hypothetical protein MSAN_01645800 [Mycena sanguinolenta]
MFSKFLALGLGALAFVRAAPALSFQTPLLSCSVNLDAVLTTVSLFVTTHNTHHPSSLSPPVKSLDGGQYMFYNEAFGDRPLRVFAEDEAVWVGPEDPGDYARWSFTPSGNRGSEEYTINNIGSGTRAKIEKGMIYSTIGQGDSFIIAPAGEGMSTIQVPNDDKVWTVTPGGSKSNVFLRTGRRVNESLWRIVQV